MALWYSGLTYFAWHYGAGLGRLFHLWLDFTWYIAHLFSLPLLTRTLFSPWKRMNEYYAGGGIEIWFQVRVVNLLARIVGFIIRLPILLLGCTLVAGLFVTLPLLYLLWFFMPLIIVGLFYAGLYFFAYV